MVAPQDSKRVEGEIVVDEGEILYDLEMRFIKEAELSGTARYNSVSTDHLLFEARLTTEPRITVYYKCECRKRE